MKRLLILLPALLLAAQFPEVDGSGEGNRLKIKGYYFNDANRSCNIYFISGAVVGTQSDHNSSDLVDFTIYDDGHVVAHKELYVPVGKVSELNLTLFYETSTKSKAPGVAIESKDLGLYIDPFIPEKNETICKAYLKKIAVERAVNSNCKQINRFGASCR